MDVHRDDLAALIDHTTLSADVTGDDLDQLCREAEQYGFGAVCVYADAVPYVDEQLDTTADVAAVAGFPHGQNPSTAKAEEAAYAVEQGADEIDVVINQRYIKEGRVTDAVDDLRQVRDAVPDATLKVICENCNLSNEEQVQAYEAAYLADADFIKTSTGMGEYGAHADDVALMADTIKHLDADMGIKASGGIGTADDALTMLDASGMDPDPRTFRIGASRGPQIVDTYRE